MRKLTVATCLLIGLTVGWSVSAEAGKNVCRGMSKAQGFHGVQKHDFVNMCQQHIGVVCAALLRLQSIFRTQIGLIVAMPTGEIAKSPAAWKRRAKKGSAEADAPPDHELNV